MVALVRSAALTGYAALARDFGLTPEALAAIVGLPSEALTNPDLRIPAGRVGRLLELSAVVAGADDFGLRLAETRQPSNLGMLALVVSVHPGTGRVI
jgi:ParB-like chromosome segregation protein Spo0J